MFPPLTDFLAKTSKQIARDGAKIAPAFEDVRIHRMRTRFKKTKALLHFAGAAGSIGKKEAAVPPKAKKLYRAAGEVRDAQVLLLHVSALQETPLPRMALWLAGRIATAQANWSATYKKTTLKAFHAGLKKVDAAAIRPARLRKYFRDALVRMQEMTARPRITDEELHDLRKEAKDLQYLFAWARRYWPEGAAAVKNFPLKKIRALGELAGTYNDLRNAIATLRRYARTEEDDAALQAAGTVLKAWETERMAARAGFLKAVASISGASAGRAKSRRRKTT